MPRGVRVGGLVLEGITIRVSGQTVELTGSECKALLASGFHGFLKNALALKADYLTQQGSGERLRAAILASQVSFNDLGKEEDQ